MDNKTTSKRPTRGRDIYISRCYRRDNSSGTKAKTDVERILTDRGYVNVGLRQSFSDSKVRAFVVNLAGIVKACFAIRRGDRLMIQYPLKKYFTLVCRVAHLRGVTTDVLIHDLGSFRRKAITPEQELKRLAHADRIIAANEAMRDWLRQLGLRQPIALQHVWDFLSDAQTQHRRLPTDGRPIVCYAGALGHRKNEFLYSWGEVINDYQVDLYGAGFEIDKAANSKTFNAMGFVNADELIATARGQWGLVWDGDSIDACTGAFGEYLRYNNPHKIGLYLRAGLPLIVWRQSAAAPFVEERGIGIVIDSLRDIGDIITKIDAATYEAMCERVEAAAREVAQGSFINHAINELHK